MEKKEKRKHEKRVQAPQILDVASESSRSFIITPRFSFSIFISLQVLVPCIDGETEHLLLLVPCSPHLTDQMYSGLVIEPIIRSSSADDLSTR